MFSGMNVKTGLKKKLCLKKPQLNLDLCSLLLCDFPVWALLQHGTQRRDSSRLVWPIAAPASAPNSGTAQLRGLRCSFCGAALKPLCISGRGVLSCLSSHESRAKTWLHKQNQNRLALSQCNRFPFRSSRKAGLIAPSVPSRPLFIAVPPTKKKTPNKKFLNF